MAAAAARVPGESAPSAAHTASMPASAGSARTKASGWPNGYRTFFLNPRGWGSEKMLGFEAACS